MLAAKNYGDRFIFDRSSVQPDVHTDLQGPENYEKYLYREMVSEHSHSSVQDHLLNRVYKKSQ